ncbi:hypothetical protein JW851_01110 [Candidatus Woesearchaeota archaeon]|nr:hypothetical protein [Candidatus Woesearchaeota archaeon]
MGYFYEDSVLLAIVARYGKNGLTRGEVAEIHKRIFNNDITDRLNEIKSTLLLDYKNGKYYLRPDAKISQSWLQNVLNEDSP